MENAQTLKKFNLAGEEVGTVAIDDLLYNAQANGQMIKDYIVALRANARQWSANTKTRAEVNRSKKKPHAQKGGGRARQGMRSAPQYKGGGRVFGPRPKFDQNIKINKKERRAAIRALIGEKLRSGNVLIIDHATMEQPKTKTVASFLNKHNLSKRTLFLSEVGIANVEFEEMSLQFNVSSEKHENLFKSLRNLPLASCSLATNVSGYDLVVANHLVMTEEALQQLVSWLC